MYKRFLIPILIVFTTMGHLKAMEGWAWFDSYPWVYLAKDNNWVYLNTEVESYDYANGGLVPTQSKISESKGWLWLDHMPWAYSHNEQKYIYLKYLTDDKFVYNSDNKVWSTVKNYDGWDSRYKMWEKSAESFGGTRTLSKVKGIRESNSTEYVQNTGQGGNSGGGTSAPSELAILKALLNDEEPPKGVQLTNLQTTTHTIGDGGLKNLDIFEGLNHLEILILDKSRNSFNDLTPLSTLTNLLALDIESTENPNLSPLVKMKKLEYLKISFGDGITDVLELSKMDNLRWLYLKLDPSLGGELNTKMAMLENSLPNTIIKFL